MEVIVFFTQPRRLTCMKNSESGNCEMGMMQARNSPALGSSGSAALSQVQLSPSTTCEIVSTAQVLIRPDVNNKRTSSFEGTTSKRGCSLLCSASSAMQP